MLWHDLTNLLDEKPGGEPPKTHIGIDYTFRAFEDVEKEYLALFERLHLNN